MLALPDEALRGFSDDFVAHLPEPTNDLEAHPAVLLLFEPLDQYIGRGGGASSSRWRAAISAIAKSSDAGLSGGEGR